MGGMWKSEEEVGTVPPNRGTSYFTMGSTSSKVDGTVEGCTTRVVQERTNQVPTTFLNNHDIAAAIAMWILDAKKALYNILYTCFVFCRIVN